MAFDTVLQPIDLRPRYGGVGLRWVVNGSCKYRVEAAELMPFLFVCGLPLILWKCGVRSVPYMLAGSIVQSAYQITFYTEKLS